MCGLLLRSVTELEFLPTEQLKKSLTPNELGWSVCNTHQRIIQLTRAVFISVSNAVSFVWQTVPGVKNLNTFCLLFTLLEMQKTNISLSSDLISIRLVGHLWIRMYRIMHRLITICSMNCRVLVELLVPLVHLVLLDCLWVFLLFPSFMTYFVLFLHLMKRNWAINGNFGLSRPEALIFLYYYWKQLNKKIYNYERDNINLSNTIHFHPIIS